MYRCIQPRRGRCNVPRTLNVPSSLYCGDGLSLLVPDIFSADQVLHIAIKHSDWWILDV